MPVGTLSVASELRRAVREAAHPLTGLATDFDPLLEMIGDARFVLLGEASHGTHEFYRARAHITQRLIAEKGFNAVAVEADWPDAYRVNRYVRGFAPADENGTPDDGVPSPADAVHALDGFKRFPMWMWRNSEVLHFVNWLRTHNDALPATAKCGFYGLDLYSLHTSIEAVLRYLDAVDAEAALRARQRYGCFDHFDCDTHAYGYAASSGAVDTCEDAVARQLAELRQRTAELTRRSGRDGEDDYFFAEQNARLVKNAEQYYRAMYRGRVSSWNLRDQHMVETLGELVAHLEKRGAPAKVVLWAHNSHLGDARATEMGRYGELNVGQLVRERYGREAALVGFSTYHGEVTAATDWDKPAGRRRVRPALPESYEATFHEVEIHDFLLNLRDGDGDDDSPGDAARLLRAPRLERAIGVIYRPETERLSHYFEAVLPAQFDAVLHFDRTHAVEPLERGALWERGEPLEFPETYPSGM